MAEIRKINYFGAVVIPADIRKALGIGPGAWVEVTSTAKGILVRPVVQS